MMNDGIVLIDTSAWVDFLHDPSPALESRLERLLDQDRVATTPIVRLELLTGARDQPQFRELKEFIQGVHLLPLKTSVFDTAEALRFDLRMTEGTTIPVPDVLIAASAVHFECALLHFDSHFDLIEKYRQDFTVMEVKD